MNEINATQLVIRKFLYAIRNYRKEDSEAGRWLDWLGDTLQYQDLMENMEPFGAEMLAEAKAFSLKKRLGGQLKAAKGSLIKEGNSNPTQEEIEKRRMEMYGDETITAAATTREGVGVVNIRESGHAGRATTGCNNSQEAPTSNAGDESSDAGNGAALKYATSCNKLTADGDIREDSQDVTDGSNSGSLESGTSANNMRRVPQNEAPAHGFSGGRTAQGTMSRSPEAAAQSGKDYYQEALDKPTISTNSPAGAGVNLDSTHTISPDASSGNAEGVNTNGSTITRNVSRADCTSATSGQTIEALEQAGEGGVSPEVGCQASQPPSPISKPKTDTKPVKKKAEPEEQKFPHGEFENIMLTTKEYIQLCERLDNADSLIDEADQYFEAQPDKKKKYKSHYAMLLNWDRRRKEVETPSRVRRFKTAVDQDREEIKKIADYYAAKNRGEQPPMPKLKMVGAV